MLVFSLKVELKKKIDCQENNIIHYIVLHTVRTSFIFNRLTSYKRYLSFHESKFFLDHLEV